MRSLSGGVGAPALARERQLNLSIVLLAGALLASAAQDGWADCLSDFTGINRHRPDAVRYGVEVVADVLAADGTVVRRMASSSLFDMTQGLRMKTSGLNTQADFIIVGEKGWTLAKGAWVPMPLEQLQQSLESVVADRYVYDQNAREFECPGEATFEGKPYRGFVFRQMIGTLDTRVTAYFDLASYRPVATVSDADVNGYRLAITTRYRFDPTIRIERPEEKASSP